MNPVKLNLFLDILSGTIVASLLFMVSKFFYKIVIPWYENRLYKGVVLEGKWKGNGRFFHEHKIESEIKKEEIQKLELSLELQQFGYQISGIFHARSVTMRGGKHDEYENFYNIRGHINDNYVILEYNPISRKRTGLGSFVMRVKEGGKELHGDIAFIDEEDMDVATFQKVHLYRAES